MHLSAGWILAAAALVGVPVISYVVEWLRLARVARATRVGSRRFTNSPSAQKGAEAAGAAAAPTVDPVADVFAAGASGAPMLPTVRAVCSAPAFELKLATLTPLQASTPTLGGPSAALGDVASARLYISHRGFVC